MAFLPPINRDNSVERTTAPGASDVLSVGVIWVDTSTDTPYVCTDITAGVATWFDITSGGGGVTDHGLLTGLSDDDHSQYHNDTRGDARYFTETEHIATSAGAADAGKPIKLDGDGHIDATMINGADVAHSSLTSRDVAGNHAKLIPSADSTTAVQITMADGTTAALNVDTTNSRVGIGTDAPASALDISTVDGAVMTIRRNDVTVTAGDSVGKIQFATNDASTTTNPIAADIECVANSSISTDINPGRLIFRTTPATVAATPIERMRIQHTGLIGIATDSPVGALDVSSGLLSIIMGADVSTTTRTDTTSKYARMGAVHYTNAEEPVAIMNTVSSSTANLLQFGGGAANMNTATDVVFFTAANTTTLSGTEIMRIDSAGAIRIGSPTYSQSATRALSQKFEVHTSAGYGGMSLSTWSTSISQCPTFDFNKSKSANVGTQSVVAADEKLGYIIFRGSDGTVFRDAAIISGEVDGTPGSGDMPGRLTFSTTADGAAVATERMRIASDGTVTFTGVLSSPKITVPHVTQASTDTLTAAEVSGTIISNYGQEAANTQTLPDAAAGYNGMIVIGTAGAGAFHLKAGANDKIYLDGVALDDGDKASLATPAVGNYFTYWSFQTGAGAYDWIVITGQGTLTDGGA